MHLISTEKMSAFPSTGILHDIGRRDLLIRALDQYGALANAATAWGFEPPSKPPTTDPELRIAILAFMHQHGLETMPTGPFLDRHHRSDLRNKIGSRGGFGVVAKNLGIPVHPQHRWQEGALRLAIDRFRRAHDIAGMPSAVELAAAGEHGLINGVKKLGGFQRLAVRWGLAPASAPKRWSDPHLRSELVAFISRRGLEYFPDRAELHAAGRDDIADAIEASDGYRNWRVRLGLDQMERWPETRIRDVIDRVMDERRLTEMPHDALLREVGLASLADVISKSPGGFAGTAKRFGYPYRSASQRMSDFVTTRLRNNENWQSEDEYRLLAPLLEPLGLVHQRRHRVNRSGHSFDWADEKTLRAVEYNGCHVHEHRRIKPSCPNRLLPGMDPDRKWRSDERVREKARKHGFELLELWSCEPKEWPDQIKDWLRRIENRDAGSWSLRVA